MDLDHRSNNSPSRQEDVRYVRLHWVDFSGVLRTRFIPKQRYERLLSGEDRYSLAQNCMIIPISTAPDCFPTGNERWTLIPDARSFRFHGLAPSHADVMCNTSHEDIEDKFAKCPRSLLERVVQDLESEHHTQIKVGFEIEFVLLGQDSQLSKPLDRLAGYSMTAGLRAETLNAMEEVLHGLEKSKIPVHHFHSEIGDQLEIAIAPLSVIEGIDALMLAQEIIRTGFVRHGLKASMAPRPVFGGPQNGVHMHISFYRFDDGDDDRDRDDSFLSGILEHMKALCLFGMASFDSYARVVDDGGGLYIGWGTENRDLPIRKVGYRHWEIRSLDTTANVYLAVAAILAAGLAGIRDRLPLRFKDCKLPLSNVKREDLAEYGISEKMPDSLQAALDAATKDTLIQDLIGHELFTRYTAVKKKEIEHMASMTDEQRRQKFIAYF